MFGTNNICVLHTWRGIVIIQAGAVYLLLPGWLGARSRYFILRKLATKCANTGNTRGPDWGH